MYVLLFFVVFCFFFQAEDGIRDRLVTGVQTCALPIFESERDQRDKWDNLQNNWNMFRIRKRSRNWSNFKAGTAEFSAEDGEHDDSDDLSGGDEHENENEKIGRASCRERV